MSDILEGGAELGREEKSLDDDAVEMLTRMGCAELTFEHRRSYARLIISAIVDRAKAELRAELEQDGWSSGR